MPDFYEIIVKGHLDQTWSNWFAGMTLTHLKTIKPGCQGCCRIRRRSTG